MTNEERDKLIIETHTQVATTHSKVDGIEKEISVLFKALEGNGQPGLKQRLTSIEQSHRECMERQKLKPKNDGNKIAMAALGVAIFVSPIISIGVAIIAKKLGG